MMRIMFRHIAILVVASAFPLVQILNEEDVTNIIDPGDQESDGPRESIVHHRSQQERIHGPIIDHAELDIERSRRILLRRINRRKTGRIISDHDLQHYIKFNTQHQKVQETQVYDFGYGDEDDDDDEDDHILETFQVPRTGCQRINGYKDEWLTGIRSCSPFWTDVKIRQLCLSPGMMINDSNGYNIDMLPVQSEDGVLYKNRFCAICNHVSKLKHWKIHFQCEEPSTLFFRSSTASISMLEEYKNEIVCDMQVIPPYEKSLQPCKVRNKRNRSPKLSRMKPADDNEVYPISFAILMNFGFDGKTHIMFTTEEVTDYTADNKCQENEIFDPSNNLCREVSCSRGFSLKEETCVSDGSRVTYKDNDIQKITNVDTLTNNNKIALISLEVNVTYDDLGLALYAIGYEHQMVQKIATLLNISSERIQNFTAAFLNQSESSGHRVIVQTMTKEEFEKQHAMNENDEDTVGDEDDDEDEDDATDWEETDVDVNTTEIGYNLTTTQDYNTILTKSTKSKTTTMVSITDTGEIFEHSPNHTILDPRILQLSFILVPSNAQNINETVSQIIQKMYILLSNNTFKFEMNGTKFNIVRLDDTVAKEKHTFCKFGITDVYFDNQFSLVKIMDTNTPDNSTITKIYVPSTDSYYEPGEYDVMVLLQGSLGMNSNVTGIAGYALVCINPRILNIKCVRIFIGPDEYTLLQNKSIRFNNEIYDMIQYAVMNESLGKLQICVPAEYYKSKQQPPQHWLIQGCHKGFEKLIKAEGYLTAVVGRISIVALCSVFITYILFKSLRNLPGINTMNLTLALLLGETMFIEGEGTATPWVCSFVAISVHYFFLASFFWMNVMSYDVYKTFANKCILTRIRKTRKYIPRYALYAWGAPAVIVAICISIEYGEIFDSFKIGYGSSYSKDDSIVTGSQDSSMPLNISLNSDKHHSLGCWIQSPVAALITFGAPVMVIFIINMIFFVRTIISIQATAKIAHISTRRSFSHMTGKNDVMLYVRMSTVMGFTWIFGLASSLISAMFTPTNNTPCLSLHILSIFFSVFNGAQGLFIFFAFVFKKRVFYLYRGLLQGIKVGLERRRSKKCYTTSASGSSLSTSD